MVNSKGELAAEFVFGGAGKQADMLEADGIVLAEYLLPKLENGEWKRILFVPTGALMSKVSFQEGSSVPGIAQAVVIEREEDV